MPSSKRSVNVRLDDEEFEAVTELAQRRGQSRSEIIRKGLQGSLSTLPTGGLTDEQHERLVLEVAELRMTIGRVQSQLERMGNNVNQIARAVNSNGEVSLDSLDDFKSELKRLSGVFGGLGDSYGSHKNC